MEKDKGGICKKERPTKTVPVTDGGVREEPP